MQHGPSNPVILVTGASSGIGLALARILWLSNYRTVITLRKDARHSIASEPFKDTDRFLIRYLDVNSKENREKLVAEIENQWGGIDILINNAAISYRSVVEQATEEDDLLQLKTNFLSPIALTRLVLPRMRKQRWGKIINLSSVGGMMAMPTMGLYSASKFAIEGASEALWYELKPWNVTVTLVQPGFINSESFKKVYWTKHAQASAKGADDYTSYYSSMGYFIERLMSRALATPESIAKKIVKLIEDPKPPLRVPATFDAHFFFFIRRFMPRALYHYILYRNLPGIQEWGKRH